jgi:hypothetical protein
MFAATVAPTMMLMLDGQSGMGLLVRPRPGRLELGGWFLAGRQLQAALVYAVAAARHCALVAAGAARPPAEIASLIEPAVARYGWYVDRTAFGGDLYRTGRSTLLRRVTGGTVTAGEHLAECWALIRGHVADDAGNDELDLVDEIVAGRLPLPTEATLAAPHDFEPGITQTVSVFGTAAADRRRPGFDIAPVMVTWPTVVFVAADLDRGGRAFAAVPRRELASFLEALDAGRLDEPIARFMARRHLRKRRLMRREDVAVTQLWDALGPRLALVQAEPVAPAQAAAA